MRALIKRRLFHYFMALARRVGPALIDGRPVGAVDRLLYRLGNLLVYGPLKNTLGMSRVRVAYTAGEAIGPEIFNFFRSLGINMKQLYGQTEASVFVTIQPNGEVYSDTVGKPVSEVELRIADTGEVLYPQPGRVQGVLQEPARRPTTPRPPTAGSIPATRAISTTAGTCRIIDRAKDVGQAERRHAVRAQVHREQAEVLPAHQRGGGLRPRPRLRRGVRQHRHDAVGNWAERRNIAYASYQELAAHPEVYDLIQSEIEQVNRDLAAEPRMAGAQIRRFLILHKELDADDGELTRTRKVRRGFIGERYEVLVDALYGGAKRRAHQGRRDLRGRPQGHDRGRPRDPRSRDACRQRADGRCERRRR